MSANGTETFLQAIELARRAGALSETSAAEASRDLAQGTLPADAPSVAERLHLPEEAVRGLLALADAVSAQAADRTEEAAALLSSFHRIRAADAPTLPAAPGAPPPVGDSVPPEVQAALARPDRRMGRYVLLAQIGRGGMGVVHRAWDPALARVVALKMLHGDLDETLRERFLREGRAAAKLDHPGIVGVHDIGECEGRLYLAMDLLPGPTLSPRLATPVASDLVARVQWLREVAEAVGFAHALGIVHRDLKPENILFDARGRPVVTDFGLAKDLSGTRATVLTQEGALLGTPQYMSPEQARGDAEVGRTSDVFSLGVILYEALTGRRPFEAISAGAVLCRVIEDDPDPPRRYARGIPQDLESICLKALEKDPARRYPDARSLGEDLSRWLAGEPVQARPPSWPRRAFRFLRRHKAASVVACLLLAASATVLSLSQMGRARARSEIEKSLSAAREGVEGVRTARSAGNRERLKNATEDVERAVSSVLAKDPREGRAYLERGRLRTLQGRLDDARADLDQAVRLLPEFPEANAERGRVLALLYRNRIERARPTSLIDKRANRSIGELEGHDPSLVELRTTAEKDLSAATASRATGPESDLLRAWLLYVRGDWEGTLSAAQAVLGARMSEEAYLLRGLALMGKDRHDLALAELDHAIFLAKEDGEAWLAHAEARLGAAEGRFNMGNEDIRADLRVALDEAKKAEECGAEPTFVHVLSAQAYWTEGEVLRHRREDSRESYRNGIALLEEGPTRYDDPPVLLLRGELWDGLGCAQVQAKEDAREAAKTAVELLRALVAQDPLYAHAHVRLGHAYTDLASARACVDEPATDLLEPEIESYSRGIELGDEDAWAYLYRGQARLALSVERRKLGQDSRGELRQAIDDLERHASIMKAPQDPADGVAHLTLAMEQAAAGEPSSEEAGKAVEVFRFWVGEEKPYEYAFFDTACASLWEDRAEESEGVTRKGSARSALELFRRDGERRGPWGPALLGTACAEAALLRLKSEGAPSRAEAFKALHACAQTISDEAWCLREPFLAVPMAETLLSGEASAEGLLDVARLLGAVLDRPSPPREAPRLRDLAFSALERARSAGIERQVLADDPRLAPLHDDPRWKALLEGMK